MGRKTKGESYYKINDILQAGISVENPRVENFSRQSVYLLAYSPRCFSTFLRKGASHADHGGCRLEKRL